MTTTTEKIPTYMLPYFINGDSEGLTDKEIEEANIWCKENGIKEVICPTDESYQPYFTHYPSFGLPCEVVDCECVLEW